MCIASLLIALLVPGVIEDLEGIIGELLMIFRWLILYARLFIFIRAERKIRLSESTNVYFSKVDEDSSLNAII